MEYMTETNLCPLGQRSGDSLLMREMQLHCPRYSSAVLPTVVRLHLRCWTFMTRTGLDATYVLAVRLGIGCLFVARGVLPISSLDLLPSGLSLVATPPTISTRFGHRRG
jgi:hypothetical protein